MDETNATNDTAPVSMVAQDNGGEVAAPTSIAHAQRLTPISDGAYMPSSAHVYAAVIVGVGGGLIIGVILGLMSLARRRKAGSLPRS